MTVANNFEFAAEEIQRVPALQMIVEVLKSFVIVCPTKRFRPAPPAPQGQPGCLRKRTFCSRQCSMIPFLSAKNLGFQESKNCCRLPFLSSTLFKAVTKGWPLLIKGNAPSLNDVSANALSNRLAHSMQAGVQPLLRQMIHNVRVKDDGLNGVAERYGAVPKTRCFQNLTNLRGE